MDDMPDATSAYREHLLRVLDWEDAHVGFDKAVTGIPADKRGALAAGFEYSAWQLLEHIRLAQNDILDFCVNDAYHHSMKWPDDYWPKDPAPPSDEAWEQSVAAYGRSLQELKRVVRDADDLTKKVPTGKDTRPTFAPSCSPPTTPPTTSGSWSRFVARWVSGITEDCDVRPPVQSKGRQMPALGSRWNQCEREW